MLKKIMASSIAIVVMLTSLLAASVSAEEYKDDYDSAVVAKIQSSTNVFDLKAKASILVDSATGRVLLENNSHEKRPIASITKVMSMLLIMEDIDSGKLKYDDIVTASDYASSMGGSQAYIAPGEQFTVRDALKAVAMHSSNDVTVALAEKVSGSEDAFVVRMNEKAKELGMNDTHFLDCTGLTDEGHYSSAYDIAIMSRELINKHPGILEFTKIWMDSFRNGKFQLVNTNKLVKFYDGANGLKTGFTSKAGYCLVATAQRNNMQLISVVLGEQDTNTRFAESRKLLDYGFAYFTIEKISKKGDVIKQVEVKGGLKSKINAVYSDDVNLLLGKDDKNKLSIEPNIDTDIKAPLRAGQKIGEVIFKIDSKEIGKADIVSQEEVKKASFIRLFFRMILGWFSFNKK